MSQRVNAIDIARGIGILLVVMGHNDFGTVSPFFFKFIYAFHMPLFFFISGMLFNTSDGFVSLLKKRFKSLIVPFLAILLIVFVMTASFTKVNLDVAASRMLKGLYATGHYLDWTPLWFLPHLFLVNLAAFAYFKLKGVAGKSLIPLLMLMLFLVIGTQWIALFFPFTLSFGFSVPLYGLPLSLDLIFLTSFFFILGREANTPKVMDTLRHPLTGLLGLAALSALVLYFPQTVDLDQRVYQSLLVNTAEAFAGIAMVISLSHLLDRFPLTAGLFGYIGRASIVILLLHLPIAEAWTEKVNLLTGHWVLAYWVGYVAAVSLPLLINHFFIQPNPITRRLFGFKA